MAWRSRRRARCPARPLSEAAGAIRRAAGVARARRRSCRSTAHRSRRSRYRRWPAATARRTADRPRHGEARHASRLTGRLPAQSSRRICGRYCFTWSPFWRFEFDRGQACQLVASCSWLRLFLVVSIGVAVGRCHCRAVAISVAVAIAVTVAVAVSVAVAVAVAIAIAIAVAIAIAIAAAV